MYEPLMTVAEKQLHLAGCVCLRPKVVPSTTWPHGPKCGLCGVVVERAVPLKPWIEKWVQEWHRELHITRSILKTVDVNAGHCAFLAREDVTRLAVKVLLAFRGEVEPILLGNPLMNDEIHSILSATPMGSEKWNSWALAASGNEWLESYLNVFWPTTSELLNDIRRYQKGVLLVHRAMMELCVEFQEARGK